MLRGTLPIHKLDHPKRALRSFVDTTITEPRPPMLFAAHGLAGGDQDRGGGSSDCEKATGSHSVGDNR